MHKVLLRQLKKYIGEKSTKKFIKDYKDFIEAIDRSYGHFDEDRKLMERSLDISSRELNELNEKLRDEIDNISEQKKELSEMNDIMMHREYKIIELKKELAKLKGEVTVFDDIDFKDK